ncbi:hypothetical protein OS493_037281 [Desmophyllum pertusum]|uniref:Uncharacterized protein n=1 Tax=Desmophyllum pertusum TaxID=174260 RepID=A0A9X0CE02_9CNID|nr:hypothetical protein OS493_037281 [Desmophyllum pertusum]
MSSKAWKYSPLDKAAIDEAEVIAMAGVQVPKHPRVKGWEPSDVERLLPVELKTLPEITLSVLSSEPEQLKDERLFSSNASASKLKTGKTNNPSSKIKKEQLQQPQPDSDSDFESPKKRTKKQVPKKESSTNCNNFCKQCI